MTQPTALIPIADGSEDVETVCLIDVLRRGGVHVVVAGIEQKQIRAAQGTQIVADGLLADYQNQPFDLIVLPGGDAGAAAFRDHAPLIQLLQQQKASGRSFGAICASPAVVLAHHGLIDGLKATCYPSYSDRMQKAHYVKQPVVVDQNCVTSAGPGTALLFGIQCVELLCGKSKADEVAAGMLIHTV